MDSPTGNIGVGKSNPNAKLHVHGNIIANAPTADNHVATKSYVDRGVFQKVVSRETVTGVTGSSNTNLIVNGRAKIAGPAAGMWIDDWFVGRSATANNSAGDFRFYKNGDKMTIKADGNIGIGTVSPTEKLEVEGGNIKVHNPQGYPYGINIDVDYTSPWAREFKFSHSGKGTKFAFGAYGIGENLEYGYIGGNSSSSIVKNDPWMVFRSQGYVGIGTKTPTAKLEVKGNIIANAPTADNHVATKAYVDSKVSEINEVNGAAAIQTKIQQLESKNSNNQTAIASATESINTLDQQAFNIEGRVDNVESDVSTLNEDVEKIANSSILPHNLINNSYMNIEDGIPSGFGFNGNLNLEAVSPYTKCFEGPYAATVPSNAAESCDQATEANPYYFSTNKKPYYKGPRASRGGMAGGWHSRPDGRILKITGDNDGTHSFVTFPFEQAVLTDKVLLKGWIKIVKGSKVCFGADAGYLKRCRGYAVDKQMADAAPDGWFRLNKIVGISEVTNLSDLAFSMGLIGDDIEVYLALPYVAVVNDASWMPSVTDIASNITTSAIRNERTLTKNFQLETKKVIIRKAGSNIGQNGDSYKAYIQVADGNQQLLVDPNQIMTTTTPLLIDSGTKSNKQNLYLQALSKGNVGIRTTNPEYALTVEGTIGARRIVVTQRAWADHVFDYNYDLMPLEQVEQYIYENGHLPEIPTAEEVLEDGVDISDVQTKLLQKVEELTLHMIEVNKRMKEMDKRMKEVEKENTALKSKIEILQNK